MALCLSFPGCRHVQHPGMCLIKMLGAAAAQIAGKVNILMTVAVWLGIPRGTIAGQDWCGDWHKSQQLPKDFSNRLASQFKAIDLEQLVKEFFLMVFSWSLYLYLREILNSRYSRNMFQQVCAPVTFFLPLLPLAPMMTSPLNIWIFQQPQSTSVSMVLDMVKMNEEEVDAAFPIKSLPKIWRSSSFLGEHLTLPFVVPLAWKDVGVGSFAGNTSWHLKSKKEISRSDVFI